MSADWSVAPSMIAATLITTAQHFRGSAEEKNVFYAMLLRFSALRNAD
jgi:hypothetical protein